MCPAVGVLIRPLSEWGLSGSFIGLIFFSFMINKHLGGDTLQLHKSCFFLNTAPERWRDRLSGTSVPWNVTPSYTGRGSWHMLPRGES